MTQQPAAKKRPPFILLLIGGAVAICVFCVVASLAMDAMGLIPTPTPTLVPTETIPPVPPTSTNTPGPTETPQPTDTPLPTVTFTPPPEPIILTGTGDSVVDVEKWSGPGIARIAHQGGGNFAVINHGTNGERIDLLVNVIGNYQGTLPLDFLDSEHTGRFEITAGGSWEIQVLPLASVRTEPIPGIIQGVGDDVIALDGPGLPDLLKADASGGSGNFAIWTYGLDGRDLVVNEIAPYSGTVLIDSGTYVLVISATGPWSLDITTR